MTHKERLLGQPIYGSAIPIRSISLLAMICILLGIAGDAGCSRSADIAQVTGKITVAGSAAGPGTIMFDPAPSDGPIGPSAIGHFREDGVYTLMLPGGEKGAYVGDYRVMILSRDEAKFGDEVMPESNGTSRIHGRYMDLKHSGLTATVQPGMNEIDFDLKP